LTDVFGSHYINKTNFIKYLLFQIKTASTFSVTLSEAHNEKLFDLTSPRVAVDKFT